VLFVIDGKPLSSKNSRPVFYTRSGKPFIGKSKRLSQYTEKALWELKAQKAKNRESFPLTDDLRAKFTFFVPDKRKRDLVNLMQLPSDLLQRAEIIEDDCQIKCLDGSKILLDKKSPRTEIYIEPYRICFNCRHFKETVDDFLCWANGKPDSIDMREDCKGWEGEW